MPVLQRGAGGVQEGSNSALRSGRRVDSSGCGPGANTAAALPSSCHSSGGGVAGLARPGLDMHVLLQGLGSCTHAVMPRRLTVPLILLPRVPSLSFSILECPV